MGKLGKLLVVLALVVVAAACGDDPEDATPEQVVTDQAGYSVGLIDAGGDERVTIRTAAEPGARQRIRMVVEQEQEISIEGQSESVGMSQSMDMTYVVRSVDGELITVDSTYDAMSMESAEPDVSGLDDRVTGAFLGTTATLVLTDRGGIVSLSLPELDLDLDVPGMPPGAMDEFLDDFLVSFEDNADGMSLPAPVEPIGVGGSWTATSEATVAGIPMRFESTVTITEITDDLVVGDITEVLTLVEGPTQIMGVLARIDGGRLEGTGTITYLREGGIMPLLDMETSGDMAFTVQDVPIRQNLRMRQTSTVL